MKLAEVWFRVRTLLGLSKAEREMSEEFAFHLEMERKKLVREGMSGDAARDEASRRFGGMTRERQRARDQWGVGLMRDLASDVRHAFRQFYRRPAFTIAGTLTLAIGIGATISLFSVVRGTLLRPLPVKNESELHVLWSNGDWRGIEFDYLQGSVRAFSGLASYAVSGYTLTIGDAPVTTLAGVVSAEFFDVLGATPQFGHTFEKGDDRPGAEPRVVLGHALWQRAFGGDSAIVGKRITLDGSPFTVIGVMPKSFYFPTPAIELWRPLSLGPTVPGYAGTGWLTLIARAKPGASPTDVSRNIQSMAAGLGTQFTYPAAWDKTKNAHTTLVREFLLGNVAPVLLLLLGAVITLLLMACANVAALVLSRTADRTPEMTLRSALGAGRGRLARQIIAESLAMSTLSGVMGAVLAITTFGLLLRRMPLSDGLATTLHVDWSMFAVAIGLAAVVGLVVAAVPVRSVLMGKLSGVTGERSSAGMRSGHRRFHTAMVAIEMGLGVTLAAGALLLVRSVSHLYAQDTGFNPAGVVTLSVITPRGLQPAERQQFVDNVSARVRALPGITAMGFVSRLPVRDGGGQTTVKSASRPDIAPADAPNSFFRLITPGYLTTMSIPIVRGRDFTDADDASAPPVAIVSESFAKRMWPGQDPIGQAIAPAQQTPPVWITVVGVAKETRLYKMVGDNPLGIYTPMAQSLASLVLVAKTAGNMAAAMNALRETVAQVDHRMAVGAVITMDDVVAVSLADRLQLRFFLSILATLALVLGAIGVYGVVSYAVSRRRAEFGVRLALGATSGRVLREVAGGGLKPVAVGVLAGVVASVFLSRFVSSFLYGVQPRDVLSIGGAALALLVAGVAAVIIPGVRAGRTSPVEVLRGD